VYIINSDNQQEQINDENGKDPQELNQDGDEADFWNNLVFHS